MPNIIQRALAAVEPWYNWGRINTVRLDATCEAEASEGEARFFTLQWFGVHVEVVAGRTPAKPSPFEVENAQQWEAHRAEQARLADDRERLWCSALAAYEDARAESDALPDGHPDEDAAVDAYCIAMDRLICATLAPDCEALLRKVELAQERAFGGAIDDSYGNAIRVDLIRFVAEGL